MRITLILVAVLAIACGDDEMTTDAAVGIDARPQADAAVADAAVVDAPVGVDAAAADAAPPDAAPPDAAPPDAAPPDAAPPDADGSITVTLTAVDDATICSNGGAIGDGAIFVGVTNEPTIRRALVRFDLSTIPAGSTIAEARLDMTVGTSRGTVEVNAHRVTTDWNEGPATPAPGGGGGGGQCGTAGATDATWTTTGLGGNWTVTGGDFVATASGTATAAATFSITGLGTDVQGWRDATNPNYGWILVATDEATALNAARITSPPSLVVRYFAP